jgi:large subunit ribosomal protein L35
MPKLKSNRSAVKRFRQTAKGKFKFRRAYARHILTTPKKPAQKRHLRGNAIVDGRDEGRVKAMLPYGAPR